MYGYGYGESPASRAARLPCGFAWLGGPQSGGVWVAETVKRPPQQPAQPRYTNY